MEPNFFFFQVWPYVAISILASGLALRYFLSPRERASGGPALAAAWDVFGSSRLWQVGGLLLLFSHAAGLLFPHAILSWNSVALRLYVLETLGFMAGVAVLGAWASVTWKHLRAAESTLLDAVGDSIFLALLLVALISGLLTAALYRWSSSWATEIVTPYVASLVRGRPVVSLVAQLPFLTRLHVFAGFAAFAALPFTRVALLVHFAVHRLVLRMSEPLVTAAGSAEAWLIRRNPAAWIWPEEDGVEVPGVSEGAEDMVDDSDAGLSEPESDGMIYPSGSET